MGSTLACRYCNNPTADAMLPASCANLHIVLRTHCASDPAFHWSLAHWFLILNFRVIFLESSSISSAWTSSGARPVMVAMKRAVTSLPRARYLITLCRSFLFGACLSHSLASTWFRVLCSCGMRHCFQAWFNEKGNATWGIATIKVRHCVTYGSCWRARARLIMTFIFKFHYEKRHTKGVLQ